ncbi:hypothetical protein ACHAXR_012390 [Thalassiosira sp. AJA248-18]
MPSVFDRLAASGTAASDARLANEKKSREQQQERRRRRKQASVPKANPAKLQQLKLPQDPAPIGSPKRTPKQRDAFFDRLSHQETVASAAHHTTPSGGPVKSPKKATTNRDKSAVFNRLYKQETAATKAHHLKEEPKKTNQKKNGSGDKSAVFNRLYKQETAATKAHHPKEEPKPDEVLEDKDKAASVPPIPIKMNLHIRTKAEKKGGESYTNLTMPQADVRKQINLFHSGKISAHALAFDIIEALFHRDFMPGDHWDIGSAILEELDPITDKESGKKVEIIEAEKEAIWDWKDIYSVATAKATIKISSGCIHVDDYSYYVAG